MKKIAIYGAGGFGREVACLINQINEVHAQWDLIGFFDDGIPKGTKNEYGVILGGLKEVNEVAEELDLVIAIASPRIVKEIVNGIINSFISYPNVISPDVIYLDRNNIRIGKGNIICSNCLISCHVDIGDFNIFNWHVTVAHDVSINNFNAFMPDVKISGGVTIGERNYFATGSIIIQQLIIGNNTRVGANSLIIGKTKDGMTYMGSPAKAIF